VQRQQRDAGQGVGEQHDHVVAVRAQRDGVGAWGRRRGIGIVVRDEPRPTLARLALDSPADVHRWLAAVLARLQAGQS